MIDFNKYKSKKKKSTKKVSFGDYLKQGKPQMSDALKAEAAKHPFNPLNPASKEFNAQLDQKAASTSIAKNFWKSLGGAVKTAAGLDNNAESLKQFKQGADYVGNIPGYLADIVTKATTAPIAITDPKNPIAFNKGKGLIEAYKRAPTLTDIGADIGGTFTKDAFKRHNYVPSKTGSAIGGFSGELLRQGLGVYLGDRAGTHIASKGGPISKIVGTVIGGNSEVPKKIAGPKVTSKTIPNRVVQTVNTKTGEQTFYTIPIAKSKTIIDKIDNSGGIIPKDEAGNNFHVTAKTPKQMEALGFKNGGTINPDSIPEPQRSTSKIATSIEQKAIEQKLTQGFEGVAGYDPITIKDQAQRATALLADPEKAMRVITGEEALPEGLRGTALITATEEYIKKTGDVRMAYELANSPLVSETSAAAQELRLAAERVQDSMTAKLQEIRKVREQAAIKKHGSKAKAKIKNEIKSEITKSAPKAKDWAGFLEELKCR